MDNAIVGWELELIAPQLCGFLGLEFGVRSDAEGYTSNWVTKIDEWLGEQDLQSLGIWSDCDTMFGDEPSFFIGFYIWDEDMSDMFGWISEISEPMNKLKKIFSDNDLEVLPPSFHFRDAGFAHASDYDFKER